MTLLFLSSFFFLLSSLFVPAYLFFLLRHSLRRLRAWQVPTTRGIMGERWSVLWRNQKRHVGV
jgi:hypothetical protein